MSDINPIFKYITPLIGTKGLYEINDPFSVSTGEILECIAIRKLSAWISNNDDALQIIYEDHGLIDDDYTQDLAVDMDIVTLRNERGFVYHIPAKYIRSYPIQDAVAYRSIAIVLALPAIPVSQDLSVVSKECIDVVTANLGVSCISKIVDTSAVRGVSGNEDAVIQAERDIIIGDSSTIYAQLADKSNEILELKAKIKVLEDYIVSKSP